MHQRNDKTRAVGYIRVSTSRQAEKEGGLRRQVEIIHGHAAASGYQIVTICKDAVSGMPANSARQPGLQTAIREAQKLEVPVIIVADPSRLTRDPRRADELAQKSPDLVVTSPGYENVLEDGVRELVFSKALEEGRRIQATTKKALERLRNAGKDLGNPLALTIGRVISATSRRRKKTENRHELIDYLATNPDSRHFTHQQLANELNARGMTSGWGRPWTKFGIRRPRQEALQELSERLGFEKASPKAPDGDTVRPRSTAVQGTVSEPSPDEATDTETDTLADLYRSNPRFGMF